MFKRRRKHHLMHVIEATIKLIFLIVNGEGAPVLRLVAILPVAICFTLQFACTGLNPAIVFFALSL